MDLEWALHQMLQSRFTSYIFDSLYGHPTDNNRGRLLSLSDRLLAMLPRAMIIIAYTLISLISQQIPFLGAPIGLAVACLINAFYCFE